ncbi:MAG: AbgT family transporter [bacterium]
MERFLVWVERTGNRLPHPFWIFVYLGAFVIVGSLVFGLLGVSVSHPVSQETITAKNLISQHGLQRFVLEMVTNFSHFAPLGLVLVMLMGVSLSVHSGFMETVLVRMTRVPEFLTLPVIVLAGIMGNLGSDAGIVVVPPLAAVAFKKMGKNPLAGIVLAYAACTAGFTATLIPRGTDVLLAGFTNSALDDPNLHVGASANLYFMIASVFLITGVMTWVAKRYTLPALEDFEDASLGSKKKMGKTEKRGFRWALAALAVYSILALLTVLPENGLLRYDVDNIQTIAFREKPEAEKSERAFGRTAVVSDGVKKRYAVVYRNQKLFLDDLPVDRWTENAKVRIYFPEGDSTLDRDSITQIEILPDVMRGPFFRGLVAILFFFFAIPGTIFGVIVGKIRKLADIPGMMVTSVKGVAGLIVLVLVISQFVAFFQWSNLDRIVAISGANLLNRLQVQGPLLFVVTILMVMGLNLFLGSSSAKWAMLAPIIVPMFLYLNPSVSPAISQLVYRIGDSTTNGISPLYPYFPLALGWVREYKKDAGIGTLIRLLFPYAIFTGIAWIVLLLLWYFIGIPVGPGEAIR